MTVQTESQPEERNSADFSEHEEKCFDEVMVYEGVGRAQTAGACKSDDLFAHL